MHTPLPEHPRADVDRQLVVLVEQLTLELHPGRAHLQLHPDSRLEGDAGLDSLGRMELLRRMEQRFATRVDEQVVVRADTIRDLLKAVGTAPAADRAGPIEPRADQEERYLLPQEAQTLTEVLAWHVRRHPERAHIHLYESEEQPHPLSYRDLWEGASRIAGGLRARGIEPGQRVALMLPTSADFFHTFVGILLAGAVPVPIYPPFRINQIEEHLLRQSTILENAQTVMLVTVEQARPVARLLKSRLPSLQYVLTAPELQDSGYGDQIKGSPTDIALIQYTSGSTGNPKGVVLSHANLLANVRAMGAALKVNAEDVFVSWLPLYHDMGLIGAWMGSLYHGIPLVLMSPLSFIARPRRWLWAIHHHRGTLSAAPNFAYDLCASRIDDRELEGLDLSSWRFTCNGAEPVSADTIEQFTKRFATYGFRPETMAPVYGLAECSVGLAFPPLGRRPRIERVDADAFLRRSLATPKPDGDGASVRTIGCGFPLPGHELRVVDERDHELPERHVGRVQFRGPSATSGYFRNPAANAQLFHGDWLDSGDYGYIDDGELFISGRAKDMIIRAGRNIYPYELEQAIGELPEIRKGGVAVFGSTDAGGREQLIVLAETRERRPEEQERVRKRIEQIALEIVQVAPDDVVLAPPRSVPKTSSGKIRRATSRELYERGQIGRKRPVWLQLTQLALTSARPLLRRAASGVRTYSYAGYAWAMLALFALPVWLLVLVSPNRALSHAIVRTAVRSLAFVTGIELIINGRERIPDGPCIVAANHASYLDALILSAALPARFRFVGKRELAHNRLLRVFLAKAGTLYVERFDPQQGVRDTAQIIESVARGCSLVFFPEGTFTRAPGLRAFRMGAFVTAAQTGLSVLPVTITGTRAVLRGDQWLPRRGRIELQFGTLVGSRGDDWQAAMQLRDAVRRQILEQCREPDLTA